MNKFFERRYVIAGIFITIFLVLLARLFYIQIVDDHYAIYATKNVIRTSITFPARGTIVDRNGKILVDNEQVYDIMVTPKSVKPFDTTEFCKLIGIEKTELVQRLQKAMIYGPNVQSTFAKQLSPLLYASLEERMSEFVGFSIGPHPVRTYPDSVAAQFLGYIGEISPSKVGGYYRPGDYIGISGVEKEYEEDLRGQRGVQKQMVDSRGVAQGKYANGAFDTAATPGARLTASLDADIQKLGEQLMKGKLGSIVAIDPTTGEILCFVSSPTYNPNEMVIGQARSANYKQLYDNPYQPFFIRPIQARYPPGSSFKPLSGLIALQKGMITPQTTYYCRGYYQSGNRRIPCFHGEAHGLVTLSSAVAVSCNGYFSMVFDQIMNSTGPKNIPNTFTDWRADVTKFGLGAKLGIDLPSENPGSLPTVKTYDKMYKPGTWRSSTINSLAIGQGETVATPLQLANIECTIANHGFYYTPHLIKNIGGKSITRAGDTVKHYVGIDGKYFEPVIDGMQAVVEHGTAILSKIPGIIMCGKTGTAQVNGEDNSVFVAFAPRENPKIAIAVIVENAGEGAKFAAPIASFIVEKYLKRTITPRESGYTVEHFAETSRLPNLSTYYLYKSKLKAAARDSAKKAKKAAAPANVKSVMLNKNTGNKYLAAK